MRTWLKAVGPNLHVGVVNLQAMGRALQANSRPEAKSPFFRYRRVIIFIDTKD